MKPRIAEKLVVMFALSFLNYHHEGFDLSINKGTNSKD